MRYGKHGGYNMDIDKGCSEREWKVLRHGVTWSDRFKSEDRAINHIFDCMEETGEDISEYRHMKMTEAEIRAYTHPREVQHAVQQSRTEGAKVGTGI